MELSDSAKMYISNYYVLEVTRKEVQNYLEKIAYDFGAKVEERSKGLPLDLLHLEKYIQNGGGNVEIIIKPNQKALAAASSEMDDFKFSVIYNDAIRNESFAASTQYVIKGFTPKTMSKFANEVKQVAELMGLPDPYKETTRDLLEHPYDETVAEITRIMMERIEQFIKIFEFLQKRI